MRPTRFTLFFPSVCFHSSVRPCARSGARLPCSGTLALSPPAAASDGEFAACLQQLRGEAVTKGVSPATFDQHTAALVPDMAVVGFLDAQPEFVTPIWDYMAGLVDAERVADGRAMLERWADVLFRVESQYGVDAATVVAVWGVESNFGRNFGSRPLLTSLSTLSCFGRRQAFFRGEFFTTLKIIQEEHVAPERLLGSWAGAFGHTQFMPSTFMQLAVDFDGDGRRDLVDSVPDALASTGELPQARGLAQRFELGLRGRAAEGVRYCGRRAAQQTGDAKLGRTWCEAGGWICVAGCGHPGWLVAARRRSGPRISGDAQFRCFVLLQRGRELCLGNRPPGRPPAGGSTLRYAVANR